MKVAVIRYPGSNCDIETLRYFSDLGESFYIWHSEYDYTLLNNVGLLVLPGGFAFGDRVYDKATDSYTISPGTMALDSPVNQIIIHAAKLNIPIIGICNGFQILTQCGLLPGKLILNDSNNFESRKEECIFNYNDVQEKFTLSIANSYGKYVIDNVITRCPTNCLSLNDDDTLEVDNRNCVKCMHCLNVMPKALSPGDDKGATVLMGGKRTLKVGDLMGTVIVPFMKLETEEDYEKLTELAEETIDFWAENGLEHERCGEMIERIGLVNFLDGIGVDVDPNMVADPTTSSYVRMDGWDDEAEKWFKDKLQSAGKAQ